MGRGPDPGWYEVRPCGELLRYVSSALVVGVVAATGAEVLTRVPAGAVATDAPDAVMIDLPPALASSQPRSEAPDGLEQAASEATPPAPPAPPPKPIAEPTPEPPPPEAPRAAAVIEKKEETPPPPPPPVAAAPAVEEQAPSGADAPKAAEAEAEPPAAAPDSLVITAWQRAMVGRLETAKHRRGSVSRLSGTVVLAFRIDRDGRVLTREVSKTSGNPQLDAVGLALLADAAPFPRPPAGLDEAGLSFTVPIRINPRR